MIVELTPAERAAHDAAMPDIFQSGFHADRLDWYTLMVIEDERVRGGVDVIPEVIAAMTLESGLRNRIFGDSDKTAANFGIDWMQHDTLYKVPSIEVMHMLRADPLYALHHTLDDPDLCYQGANRTHFRRQRWHAWEPEKIDPSDGTKWNPLSASHDAWDRVAS